MSDTPITPPIDNFLTHFHPQSYHISQTFNIPLSPPHSSKWLLCNRVIHQNFERFSCISLFSLVLCYKTSNLRLSSRQWTLLTQPTKTTIKTVLKKNETHRRLPWPKSAGCLNIRRRRWGRHPRPGMANLTKGAPKFSLHLEEILSRVHGFLEYSAITINYCITVSINVYYN